jgi:6-pyruvoyl-tetrahydropterin synthase
VVLARFDRRNLNVEVPEFTVLVPTTENLVAVLARRIADAWPHWFAGSAGRFEKLRIWETRRNIFEVAAPQSLSLPERSQESLPDEIIQSRR